MPLVSVIIPTYNWSEALKLAIGSVLRQTHQDFELVVVGDACTDDSAEVVASCGDSRVRWHNLTERAGCQSGPNNYGLSVATGALIAYLGHDDLWHPRHLERLIHTQITTGADIVCSVGVMYGPAGSGVRAVSGVFVEGHHQARDFLPPSTLLLTRSLLDRIGPWRMPDACTLPIDAELVQRAVDHGARITSTGSLTAFKFNASWRRDSYRRRSVDEQRELSDCLRADPDGCAEAEWLGLVRAARESLLRDSLVPPPAPTGTYHRANLTARGLADPEVPRLTGLMRFTLDDQTSLMDWHLVERDEEGASFRWSGPSPVSVLVLPVAAPPRFRVRLQLLNWFAADLQQEVELTAFDRPLPFVLSGHDGPHVCLEGEVTAPVRTPGPLRIHIRVARRRCPYVLTNGAQNDRRWLGVCVRWVELEPLPAS